MKTHPVQNLPVATHAGPLTDDFNSLYKIYVGLEKDRHNQITALEIIDGYLKHNERMFLKSQYLLDNGLYYLELEIVPNSQMNTYLKVNWEIPEFQSILVKTFRQGVCVGYQWIDQECNILNAPLRPLPRAANYEVSL